MCLAALVLSCQPGHSDGPPIGNASWPYFPNDTMAVCRPDNRAGDLFTMTPIVQALESPGQSEYRHMLRFDGVVVLCWAPNQW
jgi:hypothetical protein